MGWDHTPNTATTTRTPVVLSKHTRHNINTGMFLASLSLAELLLLLVYIPLEVFLFTFIFLSSAFHFHLFIAQSTFLLRCSSPLSLLFLLLITFTFFWDVIHFHFSCRLFCCFFGVFPYFPHHVIFLAHSLLYFTVSSGLNSFFTCSL